MKIKLTKGYITVIDDEDYKKICHCKWQVWIGKNVLYAVNRNGKKMHRLIMDAKDGESIDHKDGNGLNNKKSNLRFANKHFNAFNNTKHTTSSSSKYKGVDKNEGRWRCRICVYGKSIFIGRYNFEEEAGKAYNKEANKYFGEYAKLNKPKYKIIKNDKNEKRYLNE